MFKKESLSGNFALLTNLQKEIFFPLCVWGNLKLLGAHFDKLTRM